MPRAAIHFRLQIRQRQFHQFGLGHLVEQLPETAAPILCNDWSLSHFAGKQVQKKLKQLQTQ